MNTRSKIVLATCAGIVMLGAAGGAVAHRDGGDGDRDRQYRGQAMMEMLDVNKDGKITKAEAEAFRDQKLAEFDADKDGALSQSEYVAMVNSMMADRIKRRFQREDVNNSGTLDKTEISGRIDHMFERMDANKDGVVDSEEMAKHRHHDGMRGKDHGDDKEKDKT